MHSHQGSRVPRDALSPAPVNRPAVSAGAARRRCPRHVSVPGPPLVGIGVSAWAGQREPLEQCVNIRLAREFRCRAACRSVRDIDLSSAERAAARAVPGIQPLVTGDLDVEPAAWRDPTSIVGPATSQRYLQPCPSLRAGWRRQRPADQRLSWGCGGSCRWVMACNSRSGGRRLLCSKYCIVRFFAAWAGSGPVAGTVMPRTLR